MPTLARLTVPTCPHYSEANGAHAHASEANMPMLARRTMLVLLLARLTPC